MERNEIPLFEQDTHNLDELSDLELLRLAAKGQEILTEATVASPLVYRLLGRRGLVDLES